jgi:hypothetical protein
MLWYNVGVMNKYARSLLAVVAMLPVAIVMWVVLFVFAYVTYLTIEPIARLGSDAPVTQSVVYPIPPEVEPIVQQVDIDHTVLSKVDIRLDQGSGPCGEKRGACYSAGVLYFPRSIFSQKQPFQNALFSHEYMHFIWDKYANLDTKNTLQPILIDKYNSNPKLRDRLSTYPKEGDTFVSELQAYTCTEMADNELGSELYNYCTKYLPNRNALPSYY